MASLPEQIFAESSEDDACLFPTVSTPPDQIFCENFEWDNNSESNLSALPEQNQNLWRWWIHEPI